MRRRLVFWDMRARVAVLALAFAMTAPANADEMAALAGDVLVFDGSSTVYPVTQAAAEGFAAYAPEVQITASISGTGGGFERFCNGETDSSDASRPISPAEAALCAENGVVFIEPTVAYDRLSGLANSANDWAECLTVDKLNSATGLPWVAHNLERIADRVTNIRERVVFAETGELTENNVSTS